MVATRLVILTASQPLKPVCSFAIVGTSDCLRSAMWGCGTCVPPGCGCGDCSIILPSAHDHRGESRRGCILADTDSASLAATGAHARTKEELFACGRLEPARMIAGQQGS